MSSEILRFGNCALVLNTKMAQLLWKIRYLIKFWNQRRRNSLIANTISFIETASRQVEEILQKASEKKELSRDDLLDLMECDPTSPDAGMIRLAADNLTRKAFGNAGEIHAQIGLNHATCTKGCKFCSFGIPVRRVELTQEEILQVVKQFQEDGTNAVYLMATADYKFEHFIEIGRSVRQVLDRSMPLVANIGDFDTAQAHELVEAGFTAMYHVVRIREGIDTKIEPSTRVATIKAAKSAGLDLSYCVEPIGPEHTKEEIVDAMLLGRELRPSVMAAMRRIAVPGVELSKYGQISEIELAKIVAITRLAIGRDIRAMGVHEPNAHSLTAGANQIYAEAGPNPRDQLEDTSKGRGFTVARCRQMLLEAGFRPRIGGAASLQGPLRAKLRG